MPIVYETPVYMGNVFHIDGSTISISPLQSRVEAIQKLQPQTNVKECKSFCGVVNYLSIFCRHLQKLLKLIYDLTRKGRPFQWQEEQQQAFDTIKERMIKPPMLYLPKPGGRFILYCDSSRTRTGSSLWQIQEGKPRLIGYASKSLPAPALNYSVTELEMIGMAVNIHLWRHLLHSRIRLCSGSQSNSLHNEGKNIASHNKNHEAPRDSLRICS